MEASQTTEIVTEIPVMEIDLRDLRSSKAREEDLTRILCECADTLQAKKLALIPSAADVFQVLPVQEEEILPGSALRLLTGEKDRIYIARAVFLHEGA